MAMDVCAELYGSTTYRGLTAEQVLAGWLFYFDEWHEDYLSYRLSEKGKKEERRRALIGWLGSGEAFRIYPYHTADGRLEWLSLTGRRPSRMDLEQWKYMLHAMPEVSNCLSRGKNIAADSALTALAEGQRRYAGSDLLPSDFQFGAERFYNGYVRLFPAGGIMFVCGLLIMVTYVRRWVRISLNLTALLFLILVLLLRGIVGGHIPLGNGCETMIFMGFVAAGGAAVVRDRLLSGAFLTVAAVATLVAAMSSKTPQIASLMPVLSSPLLAIHVMLVMCAYAGCMLMAILGLLGLLTGDRKRRSEMALLDRILLAPTLFLLTAGIFVGAVWANQSWGRYWGWDPKETCALVTMLVYALPAHSASVRWFRDDTHLLGYLVAAILSVAFTYFGANYLLPGLHSYA